MQAQGPETSTIMPKAFVFAFVAHVAVIYFTGFSMPSQTRSNERLNIDVTLAMLPSIERPDSADFIAANNQAGSGSLEKKARVTTRQLANQPTTTDGDQLHNSKKQTLTPKPSDEKKVITTRSASDNRINKAEQEHHFDSEISTEITDAAEEIKRLMAETSADEQSYARRPKINFLDSVSAKSRLEAQYLLDWAKQLERIGNINFPQQIVEMSLGGRLIVNVTVNQLGEVVSAVVDESSGVEMIDQAALRFIHLAAPYKKLPDEVKAKYDRINISRTLIFHQSNDSNESMFNTE